MPQLYANSWKAPYAVGIEARPHMATKHYASHYAFTLCVRCSGFRFRIHAKRLFSLRVFALLVNGHHHAYAHEHSDDLRAKVAGEETLRLMRTRPEPYLTRAFHGASIEMCLENAYAEVPIEQIDDITDMWGFTMVTGIAAIEITYTDKDWPSDPSKIVSMIS